MHLDKLFQVGQEINVKILNIDEENRRISVGCKQLKENPWEKIEKEFKENDVIDSFITRVEDKFLTVSVLDDISGIVSQDDVEWVKNKPILNKSFHVGDKVKFQIRKMDVKNRKIHCSIKHVLENPYIALRDKYPSGTPVSGTIIKSFTHGVLIQIEEQFVGLLPLNNIPRGKKENLSTKFKKNSTIDIIIDTIDEEFGKIIFSLKEVYERSINNVQVKNYVEKEENIKEEKFSFFSGLKDKL